METHHQNSKLSSFAQNSAWLPEKISSRPILMRWNPCVFFNFASQTLKIVKLLRHTMTAINIIKWTSSLQIYCRVAAAILFYDDPWKLLACHFKKNGRNINYSNDFISLREITFDSEVHAKAFLATLYSEI